MSLNIWYFDTAWINSVKDQSRRLVIKIFGDSKKEWLVIKLKKTKTKENQEIHSVFVLIGDFLVTSWPSARHFKSLSLKTEWKISSYLDVLDLLSELLGIYSRDLKKSFKYHRPLLWTNPRHMARHGSRQSTFPAQYWQLTSRSLMEGLDVLKCTSIR